MIEQLFREDTISENEEYRKLSGCIADTLDELTAQLREADRCLLQRLCGCYAKREEVVKEQAYQEGFRAAMGIVRDMEHLLKKMC